MKARYLRMLEAMSRSGPASGRGEWSIYILHCADGTLYTGIAKDVDARLRQHNAGRGAAYTRTRTPARLLHREDGLTRAQALVREAQIKKMPRARKEALFFIL